MLKLHDMIVMFGMKYLKNVSWIKQSVEESEGDAWGSVILHQRMPY